jgi:hypothetical protein
VTRKRKTSLHIITETTSDSSEPLAHFTTLRTPVEDALPPLSSSRYTPSPVPSKQITPHGTQLEETAERHKRRCKNIGSHNIAARIPRNLNPPTFHCLPTLVGTPPMTASTTTKNLSRLAYWENFQRLWPIPRQQKKVCSSSFTSCSGSACRKTKTEAFPDPIRQRASIQTKLCPASRTLRE